MPASKGPQLWKSGTWSAGAAPVAALDWSQPNLTWEHAAFWVSNDGPDPIYAWIFATADSAKNQGTGTYNPDIDSMQAVTIPAGQSKSWQMDFDCRTQWKLSVQSTTASTCSGRWGVNVWPYGF